jgi:hypothetical protein
LSENASQTDKLIFIKRVDLIGVRILEQNSQSYIMFRFCLLFAGVAILEKSDKILRQKTAHFKVKNVHFN